MEWKILVAYTSTHGATQEVAEKVATELRAQGAAVDLQPAGKVRSLQGYSAVVLGAPLYMFHMHRDALGFLSRHQKALSAGLPIAIFAGGPFAGADGSAPDEKTWREVRQSVDKELAKFPWLAPASVQVIGGKFDPAHLRFPYNLIPALKQLPASDLRDWDAIRAWAASLVTRFQPALS